MLCGAIQELEGPMRYLVDAAAFAAMFLFALFVFRSGLLALIAGLIAAGAIEALQTAPARR